jgi:hypothetical protein
MICTSFTERQFIVDKQPAEKHNYMYELSSPPWAITISAKHGAPIVIAENFCQLDQAYGSRSCCKEKEIAFIKRQYLNSHKMEALVEGFSLYEIPVASEGKVFDQPKHYFNIKCDGCGASSKALPGLDMYLRFAQFIYNHTPSCRGTGSLFREHKIQIRDLQDMMSLFEECLEQYYCHVVKDASCVTGTGCGSVVCRLSFAKLFG